MINDIAKPVAVIATEPLPEKLRDSRIDQDQLDKICLEKVDYSLTHPINGDQTYYISFYLGDDWRT